jgi:hypothetical protein
MSSWIRLGESLEMMEFLTANLAALTPLASLGTRRVALDDRKAGAVRF